MDDLNTNVMIELNDIDDDTLEVWYKNWNVGAGRTGNMFFSAQDHFGSKTVLLERDKVKSLHTFLGDFLELTANLED